MPRLSPYWSVATSPPSMAAPCERVSQSASCSHRKPSCDPPVVCVCGSGGGGPCAVSGFDFATLPTVCVLVCSAGAVSHVCYSELWRGGLATVGTAV